MSNGWLAGLTDSKAKALRVVRVNRLAAGNFGDCKPLRDGVQELCVDMGPGYRVYLSRQGPVLLLLLCGGDKSDQSRERARFDGEPRWQKTMRGTHGRGVTNPGILHPLMAMPLRDLTAPLIEAWADNEAKPALLLPGLRGAA